MPTFNLRFTDRSASHRIFANRWLWLRCCVEGLQVAVVYRPFLQPVFLTILLAPRDWSICIAVASSVVRMGERGKSTSANKTSDKGRIRAVRLTPN
jgi:Ca2+-transporting ATPase